MALFRVYLVVSFAGLVLTGANTHQLEDQAHGTETHCTAEDSESADVEVLFLQTSLDQASLNQEKQQPAEVGSNGADDYYWPSSRGRVGNYGTTPYRAPFNLTSAFAWSWHHPLGRFHTSPYGLAIDHEKSIYATTDTSIWKLSSTGETLWSFTPTPRATIFSAGSLLDGRMHFTTLDGRVWAISMDTGKEIWSTKVCDYINHDNGFVQAHEGVVVAATNATTLSHSSGGGSVANTLVQAVNATTGVSMWTFEPQMPIWNLLASFPGDGTIVYEDFEGRSYCNRLSDGKLLWKSGGEVGSWTDGQSSIGKNNILYTPVARMGNVSHPGATQAIRLSDGKQLWKTETPTPPNDVPSVGRLFGRTNLSVVQAGGWQGVAHAPTSVMAMDAETGTPQWFFQGPTLPTDNQAGMLEGIGERFFAGATASYISNPWSAPTIDADGTVFVGHEGGLFFALRDTNGDGIVSGPDEVSTFQTGASFSGSVSPAHAPGMMAVATYDTVFVFTMPIDEPHKSQSTI